MGFSRPIRVIWHGEWNVDTGFGGVSRNILDRLFQMKDEIGMPKYEITVMSLSQGVNPMEGPPKANYRVIPQYGNRATAPFGQDYAAEVIRNVRPDVIITFGDTWMLDFWNEPGIMPPDLRNTFKLIAYVAIDGYPVPDFWIPKYQKFDKVITFTKFGRESIEERAKMMNIELSNMDYISHGVDINSFKPLPKAQIDQIKKQRGMEGKTIIGMFSRNQPRKHHPEFIEFAAHYLERVNNDPNVLFYFHCIERDAGWDLPALTRDYDQLALRLRFKKYGKVGPGQVVPERKYELMNRFFYPGITNPANGYKIEDLNVMYNLMDAHVLLTSGEGWGLSLTESMSAGIPTFTNDYAAAAEQIVDSNGGGVLIKARDFTYRGSDHNFFRPHTDFDDAVDKVYNLLHDEAGRKKMSKRARAYGLSLNWDILVEDWDRVITEVMIPNPEKSPKVEVF